MSGMLRYLCATGTERILDNSSTKNLVVKSHFLLGSFICYYRIPVEWIQGLVRGVGATGAVLLMELVTDPALHRVLGILARA